MLQQFVFSKRTHFVGKEKKVKTKIKDFRIFQTARFFASQCNSRPRSATFSRYRPCRHQKKFPCNFVKIYPQIKNSQHNVKYVFFFWGNIFIHRKQLIDSLRWQVILTCFENFAGYQQSSKLQRKWVTVLLRTLDTQIVTFQFSMQSMLFDSSVCLKCCIAPILRILFKKWSCNRSTGNLWSSMAK